MRSSISCEHTDGDHADLENNETRTEAQVTRTRTVFARKLGREVLLDTFPSALELEDALRLRLKPASRGR